MDQQLLMIQTVFRHYFVSGNMIIDMIIGFILIVISQQLMSGNLNLKKITKYCNCKKKHKSEYIIEGRIKNTSSGYGESEQLHFPKEFSTIMYKLSNLDADIKSVKQYDRKSTLNHKHFSYVINDTDEIRITDDIWIIQENSFQKSNDIKIEVDTYTLNVFSNTLTFNELHNEIYKWVKEYDEYLWKLKDDKIYYYTYISATNLRIN